jgi:hypothetical protein
MPRSVARRLTFANVAAALALLIALGAGAQASGVDLIGGRQVADGSLTGADVRNGSLTGKDIRNGSIGSVDVSGLTRRDFAPPKPGDYYVNTQSEAKAGSVIATARCNSQLDVVLGGGVNAEPVGATVITQSSPLVDEGTGFAQGWFASASSTTPGGSVVVTSYIVCQKTAP